MGRCFISIILGDESFSISDLLPTSYGQPGDVPCEALDREVRVSHVDKEMAAFLIVVAYFPPCHMSNFKMGMSYNLVLSPSHGTEPDVTCRF